MATIYRYDSIKSLNPFPNTDWRHYFFEYMCNREGFLLTVYKDIYGYYTVGIGHLISAGDNIPKQVGYTITKEKVVALFLYDMKRLNVELYANEIYQPTPFKKIGLSSFIWAHGDGEYKPGNTRKTIRTTANEATIRAAIAQWDKQKPVNQVRNKADFDMFFTGLSKHSSGTMDFRKFFAAVVNNPGTSLGVVIAAVGFFF